jgi:hypothetical protein
MSRNQKAGTAPPAAWSNDDCQGARGLLTSGPMDRALLIFKGTMKSKELCSW